MVGAAVAMPEPRSLAPALERLDALFGRYVVQPIKEVLFFDVLGFLPDAELPFIVLWLVIGATFFTLRFGFVNVRAFRHAVAVTLGRFDNPDTATGEVSHFQALSSALSATVGLGNIAGVAVAVGMGGPGAVLWMIVAGFLGMSSKFTECTLGQMYRQVDAHGHVSGGPMRYLSRGLTELGLPRGGRFLAALFAIMCIGGSFGGGNMFQANQSYAQVARVLPMLDSALGALLYGVVVAALVGVVIIGGIRRIGTVAGWIVPFMCGGYLVASAYVLVVHAAEVPAAMALIVREAFSVQAGAGGLLGVMVTGFRRAAFSNEAGVGSAAIAHSAAATSEPVREGIVALLEPFIDTIVVCTMTALVVVVTGAYLEPGDGVLMTSRAFTSVIPWFAPVLAVAVFLFAVSTMISWSYYGERCWAYLFGPDTSILYRGVFLVFVVLGALLNLGHVIDFSDLMILGMAFPNLLGAVLLSNRVGRSLRDYWTRYQSGTMRPPGPPGQQPPEPLRARLDADGGAHPS
jgi:alanine or glycine:cation symporter, AGCS family